MVITLTLALAAVAVLAAIVVVAVGGGGELSVEHPDHPPLLLPGTRPAGGTDAALLRLPMGVWGYHKQITDEALERFAHELTARDTRIAVLQQELAEARHRLGEDDQRAAPWPRAVPPVTAAPDSFAGADAFSAAISGYGSGRTGRFDDLVSEGDAWAPPDAPLLPRPATDPYHFADDGSIGTPRTGDRQAERPEAWERRLTEEDADQRDATCPPAHPAEAPRTAEARVEEPEAAEPQGARQELGPQEVRQELGPEEVRQELGPQEVRQERPRVAEGDAADGHGDAR